MQLRGDEGLPRSRDDPRDIALYKQVRALQKLLTAELDCSEEADIEVEFATLHKNIVKKSLEALEFMVWDLSNYNMLVYPAASKAGGRLSKGVCASMLVEWVCLLITKLHNNISLSP